MTLKLRRMKNYRPRKQKEAFKLFKQELHDLQHKIGVEVGHLIVFMEQGQTEQIPVARQKAKSHLLKYGDEMKKIADKMGSKYALLVSSYLESIDAIVHTPNLWMDEEKIRRCQVITQKLEKEIAA